MRGRRIRTMNKFIGLSLAAASCAFALVASSEAIAQSNLVPCCEGGLKPGKLCEEDDDCPGVCVGGFREGRPCTHGSADCPRACVGGFDDGGKCAADADCRGSCQGGVRDGQPCTSDGSQKCPGGSCVNTGTCSNVGACSEGTCTELCEGKGPKGSPSDPSASWRTFPLGSRGEFLPPPCP
jgi:hypothetical protein